MNSRRSLLLTACLVVLPLAALLAPRAEAEQFAQALSIEGTWAITGWPTMTIARSGSGWAISGLGGRGSVIGATERSILVGWLPGGPVRHDFNLQLSADGQSLSGTYATTHTGDGSLIQGWTPITWRRAR